jgi:RNA polymerase sigma-70 factor (ECF subfamily)
MTTAEIQETWRDLYPKVFGYFYRRITVREDIEDLTSIVLTSYLDKMMDETTQLENPYGYLWRVAHNQLVNYIRKKSKNPVAVAVDDTFQLIDESLEEKRSKAYTDRLDTLKQCMENTVSGDDLKIISLAILEEEKSPVIAKKLNIKADAVRQKLSRAVKKIRKHCLEIWKGYQSIHS